MAETYKQIKDLTLKNSIDGTEDVLIQSNGVTMRVKSSQLKTSIDLSNYYTKSEVDKLLDNIDVNIDMADYYDKDTIDNLLSNKANVSHTHTSADITDLSIPTVDVNKAYVDSQLANKSNTNHTHDEYISETELNEKRYATETYVTNKIAEASLSGGEVDLSGLATKDELATKADKTAIPTKTSQLTNDSGFLTEHQNISGKADKTYVDNQLATKSDTDHTHSYNDLTDKPTIPSTTNLATKTELTNGLATKADKVHTHDQYLTEHQDLSDYALKNEIPNVPTKVSQLTNDKGYLTSVPSEYVTETYVNDKLGDKSFIYLTQEEYNLLSDEEKQDGTKVYNITNATIDYSEISNTPTIPTKTSQLTNDSGFLTSDNLGVIKLTSPNGTKYKLIVSDDGSLSTELLETIPCTSISLNANTLSFTTSDSQTLTATIIPRNTTDTVLWSVSPKGIVSVSNGIVSPIANGSAVITVTCGSQSATCNVNVNIESESGGEEGSTYVFDCTPQSGTGLVHPIFLFDVNNALSSDTFSLSMDIQPISNVSGIKNGTFAVNDIETVNDVTNSVNISQKCWVDNKDDSLISLTPTIPTITNDGRYVHIGIKLGATDKSSKVQFKISNVQFKVNDRIINVAGYSTLDSKDSITIE